MGTNGQIRASMAVNRIEITDFLTYIEHVIDLTNSEGLDGHGGGDEGLMEAFCNYVNNGEKSIGISDIRTMAENHMISFAAEESRVDGEKLVKLKY